MYQYQVNRAHATFIKALEYLREYIPPLITVRRGSSNRFDIFKKTIDIDLVGMMNPTKRFVDILEFAPYILIRTKQYCQTCGYLHDSVPNCICPLGIYTID